MMDKGKEKIASFFIVLIAWTMALALVYLTLIKLKILFR